MIFSQKTVTNAKFENAKLQKCKNSHFEFAICKSWFPLLPRIGKRFAFSYLLAFSPSPPSPLMPPINYLWATCDALVFHFFYFIISSTCSAFSFFFFFALLKIFLGWVSGPPPPQNSSRSFMFETSNGLFVSPLRRYLPLFLGPPPNYVHLLEFELFGTAASALCALFLYPTIVRWSALLSSTPRNAFHNCSPQFIAIA